MAAARKVMYCLMPGRDISMKSAHNRFRIKPECRIKMSEMEPSLNVLDEPLQSCSQEPMTGYFRDGCCNTGKDDAGSHTVCVQVTREFLEFSRFRGNDLSTPRPEAGFVGLSPGDRWCLCAARWLEAYAKGMAPRVYLTCTHKRALDIIALEKLQQHAVDLN